MPLSDKPIFVPGNDGLPARVSGPWARRKHHYLRNYCGITTGGVGKKIPVTYLDVMAGPGRCREEEASEEFDGSPFVALNYDFASYHFIEEDSSLFAALKKRTENHPKRDRIHLHSRSWIALAKEGVFSFTPATLVVAFVDPTGISQLPMSAMQMLMRIPRIDLLVTIQYRLGIVLNAPQFTRSGTDDTVLDQFLGSSQWRSWPCRDSSELGRMAVDAFCKRIEADGFQSARHISVPESNPLYRFAYFSRHDLGTSFWNKILKIDEKGQRELEL